MTYTDKQQVEIATKEYHIQKVNQEISLKDSSYIGTVSHIYDNESVV